LLVFELVYQTAPTLPVKLSLAMLNAGRAGYGYCSM